ncbi:hypothetical protein D3C78_16950 [compost metagenome]
MFVYVNHEKEEKKIFHKNKASKCCYFDCNKTSIYSHIISKSISINEISENGHILKFLPQRNGDIKVPHFDLAGIQLNPAFNGFCIEHDGLFKPIDDNEINNFYGVYLQLFRSISSHIYFSKIGKSMFPDIDLKKAEELVINKVVSTSEKLGKPMDENKINKLVATLNEEFKQINLKKNYKLENESNRLEKFKEYFYKKINSIERSLIEAKFHKDKLFTLEIEDKEIPSQIFVYHTNFKIPVAVNAIHIFNHIPQNNFNFFIVVPYSDSSLIIGLIDSKLENKLLNRTLDKINSTFNKNNNSISILNFVESIVISSSDYSYFTPSVINEMKKEKYDFFANDCMFLNEFQKAETYLDDYDVSIFSELRQNLTNSIKIIDLQSTTSLPNRGSYDERYNKMKAKIDNENPILISNSEN